MFYSFFALQMLPELGAEPHSVPTNDEHSVPPYLFHSPNLALVLGLFCAPIKQNLAHLTFKYQNSKHFTTKFHFINPFSISKNLPKTLSFLFFFFFPLFYGSLPLVPLPTPKTQLISHSKTKQNPQ